MPEWENIPAYQKHDLRPVVRLHGLHLLPVLRLQHPGSRLHRGSRELRAAGDARCSFRSSFSFSTSPLRFSVSFFSISATVGSCFCRIDVLMPGFAESFSLTSDSVCAKVGSEDEPFNSEGASPLELLCGASSILSYRETRGRFSCPRQIRLLPCTQCIAVGISFRSFLDNFIRIAYNIIRSTLSIIGINWRCRFTGLVASIFYSWRAGDKGTVLLSPPNTPAALHSMHCRRNPLQTLLLLLSRIVVDISVGIAYTTSRDIALRGSLVAALSGLLVSEVKRISSVFFYVYNVIQVFFSVRSIPYK